MYTIDRFENEYALIEDDTRKIIHVLKKDLPKDAKEGDRLTLKNNKWLINKKGTISQKEKIDKLMNSLWE